MSAILTFMPFTCRLPPDAFGKIGLSPDFSTGDRRLGDQSHCRSLDGRVALLLGFSALQVAMLNAVAVGVVIADLALWALGTDRDIGGWFSLAH